MSALDELRHEWRLRGGGEYIECTHDCGRVMLAARHNDRGGIDVGPPAVSRLCPARVQAALDEANGRAGAEHARADYAFDLLDKARVERERDKWVDRLQVNATAREGVLRRRVDALRLAERERDSAVAMLRRLKPIKDTTALYLLDLFEDEEADCELAALLVDE